MDGVILPIDIVLPDFFQCDPLNLVIIDDLVALFVINGVRVKDFAFKIKHIAVVLRMEACRVAMDLENLEIFRQLVFLYEAFWHFSFQCLSLFRQAELLGLAIVTLHGAAILIVFVVHVITQLRVVLRHVVLVHVVLGLVVLFLFQLHSLELLALPIHRPIGLVLVFSQGAQLRDLVRRRRVAEGACVFPILVLLSASLPHGFVLLRGPKGGLPRALHQWVLLQTLFQVALGSVLFRLSRPKAGCLVATTCHIAVRLLRVLAEVASLLSLTILLVHWLLGLGRIALRAFLVVVHI